MIEIKQISKRFDDIVAVRDLTLDIREGEVFGLIGTNGAGKSTVLRMAAGVMKPDSGSILADGQEVYENIEAKADLCYLSDEGFFFAGATGKDIADYAALVYPSFSKERFLQLMDQFSLDAKRKVDTYSKGMKKQLQIILGISAGTRYLFCDETFDGLDPAMRQAVKSLFAAEMMNRQFTPVIASHNLRELEDLCEHVGLLHAGGVLLSRDLEEMKLGLQKVQCVISDAGKEARLLAELDVVRQQRQGSLLLLTVRGGRQEVLRRIQEAEPVFSEVIPLSLEEIFICETEVAGYEVKDLIF